MTTTKFTWPLGEARSMPRWFGAKRASYAAIVERLYRGPQPDAVFHYTSTAALISIVRNNELWLSDATFLNDKVEIEHGRDLACKLLKDAIDAEARTEVQSMLRAASAKFEQQVDPFVYVVCFSLDGDDLTQWRGYGNADSPVAIELELGPMMFGYVSEGQIAKVIYEPDDQAWMFRRILTTYVDAYAEDVRDPIPFADSKPLSREEECDLCAGLLYHTLWSFIVMSKNPAFRSEREVRFTYTAHDLRGMSLDHPEPMFRERAGRIIPYLSSKNLDFRNLRRVGETPKLPIRSVRVGPTDDQALVARGVRRLLDTFEHTDVDITLSGSPFRRR